MSEITKELKTVTIKSLRAAGACVDGVSIAKKLIDDPKGVEKAYEHYYSYWRWALNNGFDVISGLSEEWRVAHNFGQTASNSGDYGSASNSGYGGSASNSGVRGSASNSGDYGSASNSGTCGFAIAMNSGRAMSTVDNACLVVCYHDDNGVARCATGTVGENGIEVEVWYEADITSGKLIKSNNQAMPEVSE